MQSTAQTAQAAQAARTAAGAELRRRLTLWCFAFCGVIYLGILALPGHSPLGISYGLWGLILCMIAFALLLTVFAFHAILFERAQTRFGVYLRSEQPRVYLVVVVVQFGLSVTLFAMAAMLAMLARSAG